MQVAAAAGSKPSEAPLPLSFMACNLSPIINTAVTMKKFNLKKALAGEAVQTRDGRPVALTSVEIGVRYVLRGLVGSSECLDRESWTLEGRYMADGESGFDLFML